MRVFHAFKVPTVSTLLLTFSGVTVKTVGVVCWFSQEVTGLRSHADSGGIDRSSIDRSSPTRLALLFGWSCGRAGRLSTSIPFAQLAEIFVMGDVIVGRKHKSRLQTSLGVRTLNLSLLGCRRVNRTRYSNKFPLTLPLSSLSEAVASIPFAGP